MGRGMVGASWVRTLDASTNEVVPTIPVLTGVCVSPMGTTAEISEEFVILTQLDDCCNAGSHMATRNCIFRKLLNTYIYDNYGMRGFSNISAETDF
jgi:hypothetical protein